MIAVLEHDEAESTYIDCRPPFDDLAVDPEIRAVLDPLNEDEYRLLRENIIADGKFVSPLVVWYDKDRDCEILIDGYNRVSIWNGLPEGIEPPRKERVEFPDKQAALDWVIRHQLGRRNVSAMRQSYLRGKLHEAQKRQDRGRGNLVPGLKNASVSSEGKSCTPKETGGKSAAAQIAEETGVSERTVKNDAEFSRSIDAIRAVNPKFAEDYLNKKIQQRPPKQDIVLVGKQTPERIGKAIANMRAGRRWDDSGKRPEPTPEMLLDRVLRLQKDAKAVEKAVDQAGRALGNIVDMMTKDNARSDYFREILDEIRPKVLEAVEQADEWVKAVRR